MTITTTNKRNDYTANGSQTEFNFTFPVLYEVGNTPKYSLKVIVTDTNLVETVKTENVDYTVSYDAETLLGKIIFNTAPTNLYKVTLLPNVNLKQENDYTKSGTDKLSGEVLELSLDKLTLICIQLSEKVDRMLGLPEGSTLQNLKLPNINSSVANQLLSINSTGNGITTKVATDINLATVSNYIKTLLDDENSSQARTTLDAQQLNANLTALSGLIGQANKTIKFTGTGAMELVDFTLPATNTILGVKYLNKPITISNNVSDANNDIDFSAGNFTFSDYSGQAVYGGGTGQLDVLFGSGNGMLDTGSKQANSTYYLYMVTNLTTNTTKPLASLSATNPNMPIGYTKRTKINSVTTNSSSNISSIGITLNPEDILSSFNNLKSSNGYTYLPNGIVIQWGSTSVNANSTLAVTLPISFVNAGLQGVVTHTNTVNALYAPGVSSISQTQITLRNGDSVALTLRWFAIGY